MPLTMSEGEIPKDIVRARQRSRRVFENVSAKARRILGQYVASLVANKKLGLKQATEIRGAAVSYREIRPSNRPQGEQTSILE